MAKRKNPNRAEKPGRKRPKPARARASGGRTAESLNAAVPRRGADPTSKPQASGLYWLYGQHAVLAALANPNRRCKRLLITAEAQQRDEVAESLRPIRIGLSAEVAARSDIDDLLPPGAVHQGLALQTAPLGEPAWPDLLSSLDAQSTQSAGVPLVLVALDQVTDPQNVGAVLRSAAAFGATALIATSHHAPGETAALAKAASGAFELVPYHRVGNLTKALSDLQKLGFWSIGLAAEGSQDLAQVAAGDRVVLVLGAEGRGLRRLTRERCDFLARLPTSGHFGHLNVSNAAAIALYELLGRQRREADS